MSSGFFKRRVLDKRIKYNCVFGGGAIRGMSYVGAMRALKELDIEINSVAGSSVGSVFAALLAVGYDIEEIKDLFIDFNFNMFRDINISIFESDLSISKGEIFLDWLKEKIEKKFFGEKYKKGENCVRFKDINKNLYILTLDLNTNTPFIFSKENTPDEEIAFAVRASAGMPGLMKPVYYGNALLVDGDLIKSWPAWKVFPELDTDKHRLLEFRLEGSRENGEIKNPLDYINSVLSAIWYLSTENVYNLYQTNDRYDYVVIDTKDLIMFDFMIDKNTKEQLIAKGYNTTKKYFTETLPQKKQMLSELYKDILLKLNVLSKAVSLNNAKNALFVINEILSSFGETSKYIDKSICKQLKTFKENLLLNIKKKFMFSKVIENQKQTEEMINNIKLLIEKRLDETNFYVKKYNKKCKN